METGLASSVPVSLEKDKVAQVNVCAEGCTGNRHSAPLLGAHYTYIRAEFTKTEADMFARKSQKQKQQAAVGEFFSCLTGWHTTGGSEQNRFLPS